MLKPSTAGGRPAILIVALLLGLPAAPAAGLDEIWDIEAVNALGEGIHPDLQTTDTVTFKGIVLNDPDAMLDTAFQWQLYVQALATSPAPYDRGGVALYANAWYMPPVNTWPRYSTDFAPGDVVEVTGLLGFYNGKTNLNERHNPLDAFTITRIGSGPLPDPQVIPGIANCSTFDTTDSDSDGLPDRDTGGERWQGQWCRLEGVRLVVPAAGWGNGLTVSITDDSGGTLDMLCGYLGTFDTAAAPTGRFNLTAIFDQEDADGTADYHQGYRMWPLDYTTTHFLLWGDTDSNGSVDLTDAGALLGQYTGAAGSGKVWSNGDFNGDGDVDLQDAGDLLLNFTAAGGGPLPASLPVSPGTAAGSYDPATGEIILSADGIEYLMVSGQGLLNGAEAPDWSFLTVGFVDDDCDDFLGFWAMNNPQTFGDESIGLVAALGLADGDLTLTYQAGFTSPQVTVPLTVLPEPATVALVAAGLTAAVLRRRTGLSK